ncbi:MAG: sulfur oxidation c-type cytochrome SoxX [Gammaproteobacteria bacterium]
MLRTIIFFAVLITSIHVSSASPSERPNEGKKLAFQRGKGNCLACHAIEDGESPGNIGPLLKNIRDRFSDKKQLRAQIWDATEFNSETSMPPFGRNKILSEEEIDEIVEYLWSL